ncbi:MAG: tetratricopeptide repeat protein [Bacteroidia bacterium]
MSFPCKTGRRALFVLLFLSVGLSSFAALKLDSLMKELSKVTVDSNKVKLYFNIAVCLKKSDPPASISYYKKSAALAAHIANRKMEARAVRELGWMYMQTESLDSSKLCFFRAMKLVSAEEDPKTWYTSLNRLATVYFYESDYPNSLKYYFELLKLAEKRDEKTEIASANLNIGNVYKEQKKYDEALGYMTKANSFANRVNDKRMRYISLINIANIYYEKGKEKNHRYFLDTALHNYYVAEKTLYQTVVDSNTLAMLLSNEASVLTDLGRHDEAILLFNKAISIREHTKDYSQMAVIYNNVASLYIEKKDFEKATAFLNKALEQARSSGSYDNHAETYKQLSIIAAQQSQHKKAYDYYVLYKLYNDSVFNAGNAEKQKALELGFEYEKKEAIARAEQEKKDAILGEQIKRQKAWLYFMIGGLLLVLVLAFAIFRNFRIKQKANTLLESQKKEIEFQKEIVDRKNQEITDSIVYASRIQKAMLASGNSIKKHFKDHFILFKPKDIVSGDFYWALKQQQRFYVVTADCTGHGVPGAMMSMLGINLLNEIVGERQVTRPDEILNHLRKDIIKALNSEETDEESKDGMDCSLLIIDQSTMELEYAAANNSFYILRRGAIIEQKADKMPVGKSPKENDPFTYNKIKLEQNDLIVTITDGYADQFGGPHGKKFKYKPLEALLLGNSALELNALKTSLEASFKSWRGNLEQVDDVCMLGIRI